MRLLTVGISSVLSLMAAFLPCSALSQTSSDSAATSKSSDWFGTNSGWEWQNKFLGNKAPVGNWQLQYKHWFNGGPGPAAWATFANAPKPTAAAWESVPDITGDLTTTSAQGSTARSRWVIDPFTGLPIPGFGGFFAKYETNSGANARGTDTQADSRTRIIDPWAFLSPNVDPDWDPANPLDPEGRWNLGGNVALFGEFFGPTNDSGIGLSHSVALNSDDLGDAINVLDISISREGSNVTVAPDLLLFTHRGDPLSPSQVEDILDSFLTATGWAITPSFDLVSFNPDLDEELDEVFSLQWRMLLDASTTSATVFTSVFSSASAVNQQVPEPTALWLLALGLGLLSVRQQARQFRRRFSS